MCAEKVDALDAVLHVYCICCCYQVLRPESPSDLSSRPLSNRSHRQGKRRRGMMMRMTMRMTMMMLLLMKRERRAWQGD